MAETLCDEQNIKKFFLSFYLGKQYNDDGTRPNMARGNWRAYLSDLFGILNNTNVPGNTFTIRDDGVDQIYTVNNNTITIADAAPVLFDQFLANKTVPQLKVMYKAIIEKCNILGLIDKNIITELFLSSNPQPSERDNINFWKSFFEDENRYNDIKQFIPTIGNLQDLCRESLDLLQDVKKNVQLKLYVDLINNQIYQQIITEINRLNPIALPLDLTSPGGRNSIMPLIFLLISSVCGNDGNNGNNLIPSGLVINEEERTTIFSKDPATVDPRQFLAIEKFTKFRKEGDKACFLFHGVGTGKTITSISIALGNLTSDNLYNNNGEGNDVKKPLKVLVFAPQGLFYSAFMGDAEKMSIYTYNNYFIPLQHEANSFTLEKFDAQIKNDENSYYSVSFVGFNYTNLFNDYGFAAIKSTFVEEKYDVLICDEAHKILTEYIKPNNKIPFGVDRVEFSSGTEKNPGYLQTVKPPILRCENYCLCIEDYDFYEFVRVMKQSIFLTGTPIQKSVNDIINIVNFLNIKEINSSNAEKLAKDIVSVSSLAPKLFYKPYSEEINKTKEIKGIKKSIAAYTFCFSTGMRNKFNDLWLSGDQASVKTLISDIFEKTETPKPSRNWWPLIIGSVVGSVVMIRYRDSSVVSAINSLPAIQFRYGPLQLLNSIPGSLNLTARLGYAIVSRSQYFPGPILDLLRLRKGGADINNDINNQNCRSQGKEPEPDMCSNYRKNSLIFHPDRNFGCQDVASEKFKRLNNMCHPEEEKESINDYFIKLNSVFEKLPEKLLTQNLSEIQSSVVTIELKKVDTKEETNIDSIKKVLIEMGIDETVIDDAIFLTIVCREFVPSNFSKILANVTGVIGIEEYMKKTSDNSLVPITISELVELHESPENKNNITNNEHDKMSSKDMTTGTDSNVSEKDWYENSNSNTDDSDKMSSKDMMTGTDSDVSEKDWYEKGGANKKKKNKTRQNRRKQKHNITKKNKIGGTEKITVLSCFEALLKCYFHNYILQIDDQTENLFNKFEKAFLIESSETNETNKTNEIKNEDNEINTLMRTNREDFFNLMEQLMLYQYFDSKDSDKINDATKPESLELGKKGGARISRPLTSLEAYSGWSRLIFDKVIDVITGKGGTSDLLQIPKMLGLALFNYGMIFPRIADQASVTIVKNVVNTTSFLSGTVFNLVRFLSAYNGTINFEGIIDNLKPFISIYNYDYMDIAIEQCKFYEDMLAPIGPNKLLVDKFLNTDGTTFTFPNKYVENILMPYNYKKIQEINQMIKDNANLNNAFNSSDNVNLENIEESKNTYILNEKLSNIACDSSNVVIDDATISKYRDQYLKFAGSMKDLKSVYKKSKFNQIINDIKVNVKVNVAVPVFENLYTDARAGKMRKDDNNEYYMIPINITSTFSKNLYPNNENDIIAFPEILNTYFKTQIKNKKISDFNWNMDYKTFSNILQMLKIIRCGVIKHNGEYVLHPHYVTKKSQPTDPGVNPLDEITNPLEYYLPVVYPPTKNIMYAFIDFLEDKKYKYIWMNDTLEPDELDNQYYYGSNYTYPIDSYGTNNDINQETTQQNTISDKPICIVLSPGHKEGFSFTYNPAIFTLALSNTAGDEEQVYGRVLRKYGNGGLNGKYDKKIYQYFTGSTNTSFLQTLPVQYGITDKIVFRGIYDNIGYNNTVSGLAPSFVRTGYSLTSILGEINYSIVKSTLTAFQSYNVQKFIFGPDTIKTAIKATYSLSSNGENVAENPELLEPSYVHEPTEDAYMENYSPSDMFEESQLKFLYSVKKVTLDFFNMIVKDEKTETQNGVTLIKPLDLKSIIENSSENKRRFCFDNLTDNITTDRDCKLKLKNSIICKNPYIELPPIDMFGGLNKRKYTIKKNKRKINKKTRKHIK